MTEYLDASRPFPYCGGCGHPHVLRSLDEALHRLGQPEGRLAIVTDIGCVGLADPFFPSLHTVHTLHGRSTAIAAGISMAAARDGLSPLKTIVLIGDGGTGIGLQHMVHAAQANVDVTVLVHDNLVYGMTGGQHSVLTPPGMKTTTTPEGSPFPPLSLETILTGARAGFLARAMAPDRHLSRTIAEAIEHPGFACVEILELCPTFATAKGGVTGRTLRTMVEQRGLDLGVLRRDASRPIFPGPAPEEAAVDEQAVPEREGIEPDRSLSRLDRTARVILAGRAGEHVQSAALLAASAAGAAGLQATVRADNPVTQGSGFSIAELTIAPEPIAHTGMQHPDLAILLAPEGVTEMRSRGLLDHPGAARRYLFDSALDVPPGVAAETRDLRGRYGGPHAALGALLEEIDRAGWWDRKAWDLAIGGLPAARRSRAEAALTEATRSVACD